jgi:hypothetical protein
MLATEISTSMYTLAVVTLLFTILYLSEFSEIEETIEIEEEDNNTKK